VTTPATARRTTARRIVLAFALVLALFAAALVAVLFALSAIGDAEREVARLDHAKHACHMATMLAREQYIHQAHTLLAGDRSHLDHYDRASKAAAEATEHLEMVAPDDDSRQRATEIASLVHESDRLFREEVVPMVGTADRSATKELAERTEAVIDQVDQLHDDLQANLAAQSDAAHRRAEKTRNQALLAVIVFFLLAIAVATALGGYLMRSISRPVALLRASAQKVGAGDLSARVELHGDDELAALAGVFNQMAADLARHQAKILEQHRLASIGQVAAGVAHEINNPLGVMLGYVQLMRRDPKTAGLEELGILEDEIRQCQTIVAALLDLARPARLHRAEVDLVELAREAVSRLEETERLDGVSVKVNGLDSLRVDADEGKVRQIVLNLLGNAIDAARAADALDVELSVARNNGTGVVEIADRGAGIPAGARARLFEPFFSTKAKGHGLGLAIARTLARAHGGDVDLDDRPGGGTVARICLPIEAPKEAA
jgi:signal transduction histidine kinase